MLAECRSVRPQGRPQSSVTNQEQVFACFCSSVSNFWPSCTQCSDRCPHLIDITSNTCSFPLQIRNLSSSSLSAAASVAAFVSPSVSLHTLSADVIVYLCAYGVREASAAVSRPPLPHPLRLSTPQSLSDSHLITLPFSLAHWHVGSATLQHYPYQQCTHTHTHTHAKDLSAHHPLRPPLFSQSHYYDYYYNNTSMLEMS